MGGWGLLNGKKALEIVFMPDLNLSLPLTREKQMFHAGRGGNGGDGGNELHGGPSYSLKHQPDAQSLSC